MEYAIENKSAGFNPSSVIREIAKRDIKYLAKGREILHSIETKGTEIILFRSKDKFYIEKNGKIVSSGSSRTDCIKEAFLFGYLSESDYVSFRSGPVAAIKYNQRKNAK